MGGPIILTSINKPKKEGLDDLYDYDGQEPMKGELVDPRKNQIDQMRIENASEPMGIIFNNSNDDIVCIFCGNPLGKYHFGVVVIKCDKCGQTNQGENSRTDRIIKNETKFELYGII